MSWKVIPVHSYSYLQSDPFKSNLLLQSYAGLFNYILWRSAVTEDTPLPTELGEGNQGCVTEKERWGLVAKGEEEEEEPPSASSSLSAAFAKSALQHWKMLCEVEQQPIWHPFAREHAEVCQQVGANERIGSLCEREGG